MPLYVPQHTPSYKQGFAHSAAESDNPGLWKGLTGAWYPTLGQTGATLRDISRDNHGTNNGAVWQNSRFGSVLNFSSDGRNVDVSKDFWSATVDMTILCLCKPANTNRGDMAANWGGGGLRRFSLLQSVFAGEWSFFIGESDLSLFSARGGTVETDVWKMIGGTYNSSGDLGLWENGVRVDTTTTDGTLSTGVSSFVIGNNSDSSSHFFPGQIAFVGYWSRVLNPNEIQQVAQDPDALVRQRPVWFPSAVVAAGGDPPTTWNLSPSETVRNTTWNLSPS